MPVNPEEKLGIASNGEGVTYGAGDGETNDGTVEDRERDDLLRGLRSGEETLLEDTFWRIWSVEILPSALHLSLTGFHLQLRYSFAVDTNEGNGGNIASHWSLSIYSAHAKNALSTKQ
jgi:hypothetical protein